MGAPTVQYIWVNDPESTLALGIDEYEQNMKAALQVLFSTMAGQILEHAQATHPWQNQTGAAEAGLNSGVVQLATAIGLYLQHGVDYGIWLEVRWGGAYAVIGPTMESYYAQVMDAVQAMMR